MDRLAIRDKARVLIGEYGEEKAWTNTELNHLIDLSYKKITAFFMRLDDSFYVKDGSFSLEAQKECYDLPSGFIRFKDLTNSEDMPILRLYNPAYRVNYVGLGEIRVYYFRGNQVGLLDIPSAADTFPYHYVYTPEDLVNDDSIPDVPAYLGHELICHDVAIKALDLDEESSNVLTDEARELKMQILEIYSSRNTDIPRSVGADPALDELDG
jgi:hypothetical protein